MKRIALTFIFSLALSSLLYAQKPVNLSLKYETELPKEIASLLPANFSEMVLLVKDEKIYSGFAGNTFICDYKNNKAWMWIGFPALGIETEKSIIELNLADFEAQQGDFSYETTSETKKIMGYTAKKAIMTVKTPNFSLGTKDTIQTEVWYTTELGSVKTPSFQDLAGVPLEMNMSFMGFSITCQIKEIKKDIVKDSDFDLPAGAKIMTMKEYLQKMNIDEETYKDFIKD